MYSRTPMTDAGASPVRGGVVTRRKVLDEIRPTLLTANRMRPAQTQG